MLGGIGGGVVGSSAGGVSALPLRLRAGWAETLTTVEVATNAVRTNARRRNGRGVEIIGGTKEGSNAAGNDGFCL